MAPVAEVVRQHADDLVKLPADANAPADDVTLAPEAPLPVAVTEDQDAVVARQLVVGAERATEARLRGQGGEEVRGDPEARHHLGGPARLGQAHVGVRVGSDLAIAADLGPQIEVVGRRDPATRILGSGAEDAIQSAAVGVGRRAQEQAVEHAEHRRVRADTQAQRDDGDEGEAWSTAQRLDGAAHESLSFHGISAPPAEMQTSRQARTRGLIALQAKAFCPGLGAPKRRPPVRSWHPGENRDFYFGLLKYKGYNVLNAENGEDALEILRNSSVDLVLLDIMMPGISGFDVLKSIRENKKLQSLPVIIITALADKENRLKGLQLGADDFISKPFDVDELVVKSKLSN